MDFARAEEIFHSPESIKVLYEGMPVWIEELDPENKTARIHLENNEHKTVPVDALVEQ